MRNAVSDFFWGFTQTLRAVPLMLTDLRLILFALAPFAIYILMFSIGMSFAAPQVEALNAYLLGFITWEWLEYFLSFFIVGFSWVIVLVGLVYLIYTIGIIFASPFFSMIAERVYVRCGFAPEDRKMRETVVIVVRMLWVAILKSLLFLVFGLVLLVGSFIPGVAVFTTVGALLIIAFDCSDYAFEVLMLNLRQRLRFFLDNIAAYFGFSLFLGITVIVPGLIFLVLPLLVVAASQITFELHKRKVATT